jgi:hypothetical protein
MIAYATPSLPIAFYLSTNFSRIGAKMTVLGAKGCVLVSSEILPVFETQTTLHWPAQQVSSTSQSTARQVLVYRSVVWVVRSSVVYLTSWMRI